MHPIILTVLGAPSLLMLTSNIVPLSRRFMLPYTLVLAMLGTSIGTLSWLLPDLGRLAGEVVDGLS